MKKENTTSAADTPPADGKPIATTTAAVPVGDEGATEGEQLLDLNHDWPTAGGSYVRQADGKLKRED